MMLKVPYRDHVAVGRQQNYKLQVTHNELHVCVCVTHNELLIDWMNAGVHRVQV